jgi:hypothetical protein
VTPPPDVGRARPVPIPRSVRRADAHRKLAVFRAKQGHFDLGLGVSTQYDLFQSADQAAVDRAGETADFEVDVVRAVRVSFTGDSLAAFKISSE